MPVALERLGGDEGLLREFIKSVFAEVPEMLSAIRKALAGGQAGEAHRIAHGIKGMLATLEARPATLAAADVEQLSAKGRIADAENATDRLALELDRLAKATDEPAQCSGIDH